MMARPVHGLLRPPLLAVICCLLLLQVSECSRPASPSPADNLDDDDALHHQLLMLLDAETRTAGPPTTSTEVAGDGRTGADDGDAAVPPSASATTPARAVPAVVASASDRALLVRAGTKPEVLLLRSKLARRFLAGAGVDDAASSTDGAAPSCGSNNPHIHCGPSTSKP